MKKFYAFIASLLILTAAAFADVSVKKLADGKVEVTFFYGNPRAQEVVVAGDFTNWQNGALPMTKSDKGWTFVTTVAAGTVMKYKFISDGNWTADIKAPDTVDDGFGGKNGLVDVDALVAASAGTETKDAAAVPGKKGSSLKFATWSMIGYQSKWNLNGDDKSLESSGLNLKSYLKVSGDALPGVPIYIEVALAEKDTFENLYKKGTTEWSDGWKNLLVDTVFDPVYYYGGQASAKTYLGHLKLGLDTPYVNYVTGYKYAKLPPHTNVNWNTIDKEWEAGYDSVGGYSQFDFGPLFSKLLADTGVTVDVVAAPNRSADREGSQYGFYGYANAKFNTGSLGHYVDFQYNGAYGKTYDKIFDDIMEDDFIIGYQGNYGSVTVKANGLLNVYGSYDNGDGTKTTYAPASSDVGMVDDADKVLADNTASNINVTYGSDTLNATLGYRTRGYQANLMYVEQGSDHHYDITDQLGYRNLQRVWADVNGKITDAVTLGVNPYLEMSLNKDKSHYSTKTAVYTDTDTMLVYGKPYFSVDLTNLSGIAAHIDGYTKLQYVTKDVDKYYRGSKGSQFLFAEAGLKYDQKIDNDIIKGLTVMYGFDNDNASCLFNTVLASADLIYDFGLQAGFGIRTANADVSNPTNPVGFFVGAKKKLPIMYKPTAYIQYMYAMDPYNAFGDGPTAYHLDGYTLHDRDSDNVTCDAVEDYAENAAVRVGLQWDL
jgi:hypothetical protein